MSRIAERVTVNFTDKTSDALALAVSLTGDTKTEVINKALQTYALIQQAEADNGGIWMKDTATSDLVRTRFF